MMLSGLVAVLPAVDAQQPVASGAPKLWAQMQQKTKLRRMSILPSATGAKGEFLVDLGEDTPTAYNAKDFKLFFIETPSDLAAALKDYSADDLGARRQLAKVRTKYAAFAGLPGNPATFAGLVEISCTARAMDWKALGEAVDEFPSPQMLGADGRARLAAARVLSKVSDEPATADDRQKEAEAALSTAGEPEKTSSEVYAWLKYALARALASKIPAEELRQGISAGNVELASRAIDTYCEVAAAAHGRYMEIPVDAMQRAFHILWAMPGVKDFAAKAGKFDKKTWNAAPHNFRDAVALAFLLRKVYAPELKDEAISQAAELYFNPSLGVKPAAGK